MCPDSAQEASDSTPTHPKTTKSDGGLFVFTLSLFFTKSLPRSRKNRQEAPPKGVKLAILRLTLAILAPFWRQVGRLGAILAPTWPILAPKWAPRASQKGLFLRAFCKYLVRHLKNSKKAPKMDRKSSKIDPKRLPKWTENL